MVQQHQLRPVVTASSDQNWRRRDRTGLVRCYMLTLGDLGEGPTVSRVGVGVDEPRVEYLLGERPDQLVRRLTEDKTQREELRGYEAGGPAPASPLTSFRLSPCLLISSTLLILQPWQNSAVKTLCDGNGRGFNHDRRGGGAGPRGSTHLTGFLPEHFGNADEAQVLQLLRAPLGVPGLVLEVQLLSQSLLQVLQEAEWTLRRRSHASNQEGSKKKGLPTFRTHRNPKLGCMSLMTSSRISRVLMSPSNRSLRSMYCTCGDRGHRPSELSVSRFFFTVSRLLAFTATAVPSSISALWTWARLAAAMGS